MLEIMCNGSTTFDCECTDCCIKKAKIDSCYIGPVARGPRAQDYYDGGDRVNVSYWDEMSGNY